MVASVLVIWSLVAAAQCNERCQGDQQLRLAERAPKDSAQRLRGFEAAAELYRKAANLADQTEEQIRALDALASVYDDKHLNQLEHMEPILRELIALQPTELAPVFRLAKVQEDRGFIESAEDTLLAARRQKPDAIEPYRMLVQFYARRVTAMQQQADAQKPQPPAAAPGERDDDGVFRVGGGIAPPQRLDRPVYPPEALAAGVQGNVQAEVTINEAGEVTDAKVVRSIPLLDEAALAAVRTWRFAPTMVNGQPVPVRMTVTVNFTQAR
jgi:TonB family protein